MFVKAQNAILEKWDALHVNTKGIICFSILGAAISALIISSVILDHEANRVNQILRDLEQCNPWLNPEEYNSLCVKLMAAKVAVICIALPVSVAGTTVVFSAIALCNAIRKIWLSRVNEIKTHEVMAN